MRQLHKFGDRYRSQERGFFTEAQFLKFAEPRDQDNFRNGILPKLNFAANTATTEVLVVAEPPRQFALVNGGSR